MNIPEPFRKDCDALPAELRALLDAELAAGNRIADVGHSHPAPPVGAFIRLAGPVTTRPRAAGAGLRFRDVRGSLYGGEFSDERRVFFILEPPLPRPPYPDMDAIRAGCSTPSAPDPGPPADSAITRFERSMAMDYEKWRDGIGYDLDAIQSASTTERRAIERLLLARGIHDWRDVEALALFDTASARAALDRALDHADAAIRAAVVRHAPELVSDARRTASLVRAIESAGFFGGLTEALDDIEDFHPPEVVDALLRGALDREGEVAVHCAALVTFVQGHAAEPFDMSQRPFFLRFHTPDPEARQAAFVELCERTGIDAARYLHGRVAVKTHAVELPPSEEKL